MTMTQQFTLSYIRMKKLNNQISRLIEILKNSISIDYKKIKNLEQIIKSIGKMIE